LNSSRILFCSFKILIKNLPYPAIAIYVRKINTDNDKYEIIKF